MEAPRNHKIKFINDFGSNAFRDAVIAALSRHGADWFTDEQISDLTTQQVSDWRDTACRNRRNRKTHKAA
ncbi:hypothetical protein [Pseudochrobactrum sp. MP213Fo]|uniref:hypothetical protein n=1 Tax=Pseudochrobactrum sp. MP213Fo TaxID=3022250 RepID=UPI003B9F23BA